nr:hypothetical protein [Tanacetum cinerariifolium]
MSTRSSARNLFSPLDNPELTIRRSSHADPTLLNDFEMAAKENSNLPVPGLRTIEELCQPSLNGQGGPIAPIAIQATNLGLKNDMIQQSESSSSITSSSDIEITALKAEMVEINKNLMRVLQVNQQVKAFTPNCETCGGSHSFNDCPAIVGQTQNVYAAGAYQSNSYQPQGIITRSGTAYQGPMIPTTSSSFPPVVERETKETKDKVHPTNKGSTKDVQPPVVQTESPIQNSEPVVAPIIEPVVAPDKLSELARASLNEHCSAVLLKKFPEKLGDPDKFLIPCDFLGMAECLALTDLGASINLMPLSLWNKLSLPDLSPTCMTFKLADRLISHPVGFTEDVFVKVGTFYFPADFVVVDFDADPRAPLILRRSFLKTERALIDVFEGELTLRVGKEAITFNLDQTSTYSAKYNDMMDKRIDVIDMACDEYSQEVLSFSDVITSGNPTPYYDPIVSTTSLTLTPFGEKGDILLLEAFLNDDPLLPSPNQGNYLPQVRKELKICEAKTDKSSIDEPPEVELKDLHPHLEYPFLEGDDKLPVIISKDLSVEEKAALITVLKSYKRAIAWKLSDLMGINPLFFTHKILMEDDFKLVVQHQRRVNPKIHDVIKNEVLKHLDAGLIYPISDGPWTAGDHRKVQLNKLNELRDQAYENSLIYKEKTKRLHDSKIKDHVFHIGDRVLLFNSRLKIFSGKLKTRWSGPFTIYHVFPYDTVELSQTDGPNFKVNGHRLKHYFGEDIPKMVVSDLQTFSKD